MRVHERRRDEKRKICNAVLCCAVCGMLCTACACSKREYEIILKEITNKNTKRLRCISNGIDLSQINAKDYSQPKPVGEKIRIGVLGRVSNQKAPWVFASIAKQLWLSTLMQSSFG